MATQSVWYDVYTTFVASIRSVGTACTLASVGVYLHRRGFIVGGGKKTLALISQQVTIPLYLFSKVVYCNQDWSNEPCPDVTEKLDDIWVLLFWPAYVVAWGLLVGYVAATLSGDKCSKKAAMAACAFGNSTGLPITLLTVVHSNFPKTTELGAVDPTLFLSVYLLLYPVLQWGVGGWLLAPEEEQEDFDVERPDSFRHGSFRSYRHDSIRNVLNNDAMELKYERKRPGLSETDASLYMSDADLVFLYHQAKEADVVRFNIQAQEAQETEQASYEAEQTADEVEQASDEELWLIEDDEEINVSTNGSQCEDRIHTVKQARQSNIEVVTEASCLLENEEAMHGSPTGSPIEHHFLTVKETLKKIATRSLQPPVVGAMMGLFVAATPLRGIFVDLIDRSSHAPLQWFFDGLYAVGQAAVPLNMIILGCNFSASAMSKMSPTEGSFMSSRTMLAIVLGKMLVMPIIGIMSAIFFNKFIWDIPESINASFYLVVMIVFITPTANNVMVMVELSGSGAKESIAQVIAWQYSVAPILLSFTMTVAVGVASEWS